MKKFIVLIICLFLGLFISTEHHTDTIKKNDITVLAPCTNDYVYTTNIIDVSYSFTTGFDIQYYLSGIADNSNNHSTIINSIHLTPFYITNRVNNTNQPQYESVRIPDAKTLGLLGVNSRVPFNIYLYQITRKLGQT